MRKKRRLAVLWLALLLLTLMPALACAATRALLVACSDFVTQPDLGAAISGNLHMIGSAFISADVRPGDLSIEDGTIGTPEALSRAVDDAFSGAQQDDLSILYLCTHGVLSSVDDGQVYLLLGNGERESLLSGHQLFDMVSAVPGEKLLIVDACYSGALIGRGAERMGRFPGSHSGRSPYYSPFQNDPSIHVLTSSSGSESSWYYDSEHLATGAVSYFASALSAGLGLYGSIEADLDGDSAVSLEEMHRYLSAAVPSSSCQLLSARAGSLSLPAASGAVLSRPLVGFSYDASLLTPDDPTFNFSFTVTRSDTGIQYRLIDFVNGSWDWEHARTFLDAGDSDDQTLTPGRKTRSLSLEGLGEQESGYLMLQVFSVSDHHVLLCSERLIALQSTQDGQSLELLAPDDLQRPGEQELAIDVRIDVPAELTVSVFDEQGVLVRRIASSQLTRPSFDDTARLYWDGRTDDGSIVEDGTYTVTAEARIADRRHKAAAEVQVGSRSAHPRRLKDRIRQ